MSKPTATAEKTHEATVIPITGNTVTLTAPERGFQYVQVPKDLQKAAITSSGVASLCRIGNGDFIAGLSEDIQEVAKACLMLGEKGSLTIKLAFAAGGMKKLSIKPTIAVKAPKEKTEESILYSTPDGQLLTRDPDQPELDLRDLDTTPGQLRRI